MGITKRENHCSQQCSTSRGYERFFGKRPLYEAFWFSSQCRGFFAIQKKKFPQLFLSIENQRCNANWLQEPKKRNSKFGHFRHLRVWNFPEEWLWTILHQFCQRKIAANFHRTHFKSRTGNILKVKKGQFFDNIWNRNNTHQRAYNGKKSNFSITLKCAN